MANYGDAALKLPASWSRNANLGRDGELVMMIVGHEDGVSDAYLTKEPDAAHQFQWLNPKDDTEMSRKLSRHYVLIHKDEWTKNDTLWRWDDQGHCVYLGLKLAARPAHYLAAEEAKRERATKTPEQLFREKLAEDAEKRGAIVADDDGVPLKRTTRKAG